MTLRGGGIAHRGYGPEWELTLLLIHTKEKTRYFRFKLLIFTIDRPTDFKQFVKIWYWKIFSSYNDPKNWNVFDLEKLNHWYFILSFLHPSKFSFYLKISLLVCESCYLEVDAKSTSSHHSWTGSEFCNSRIWWIGFCILSFGNRSYSLLE